MQATAPFADREAELAFLEQAWHSDRAELIVVYGRRRVGKTALLQRFSAPHPGVFWVATLSSDAILRRSFTQAIWQATHPEQAEPGFTYESWERAFEALAELPPACRVVVLDEFPYLVQAAPEVPTVLQKVWDARLQAAGVKLLLCGSHIGMMERELLLYRAPLYGRRTGQLLLRPLPLRAVATFVPNYSIIQQIETFAVVGGVPAYLAQIDDRASLLENIEQRILHPASYLHQEPHFLLREELREPRNYFAILQAIAHGHTRLNEIAQATGIGRQPASRYLDVLRDLRVVERAVPVTETQPEKSRKGIYRVSDPFLRFWFRFVAPAASRLEMGATAPVARTVATELAAFIGPSFEALCRQWALEAGSQGALPFVPEQVGSWWDQAAEIDLVALAPGAALFGECKWTMRPVGTNILDDLQRKAFPLIQHGPWASHTFALFSRSGFTPALTARAQHEDVLLIDAPRLLD